MTHKSTQSFAVSYARQHIKEHGEPVDMKELVALLMFRPNMDVRSSIKLLMDMESRGQIKIDDKSGAPRVLPVEKEGS